MRLEHTTFQAMGGPCALQIYSSDEIAARRAADAAQAEVLRIETKYSRYREDSIVSRINAAAGTGQCIDIDVETSALLDYAKAAWEQSDGLFDATSGVLRKVWNFKARKVPRQDDIEAAVHLIGWQNVERGVGWARLRYLNMQLDFGGFGKEYAADRAAAVLKTQGIRHGLVELGGDIAIVGPHPDGAPWRVGIRHPRKAGRAIAAIDVAQGGVASSGDYERCFILDGKRYSHILNPKTGWPVTGLSSVSVMAKQCLVAGTATTIALLKGAQGKDWLRQLGLPWLGVDDKDNVDGSIAVVPEKP